MSTGSPTRSAGCAGASSRRSRQARRRRTTGSRMSATSRARRCAAPAAPGISAPTFPERRAYSCRISAGSRATCSNAATSRPAATPDFRWAERSAFHLPGEQRVDAAQLLQSLTGLDDLALEVPDLRFTLLGGELQPVLRCAAGFRLDHLADLGEREAELLALEDQRKAPAVGAAEEAAAAVTPRSKKAAAFVEAQGAMRQRELVRELVDGDLGLVGLRHGSAGIGFDPEDVVRA